jgi:hypothetical protein
VDAHVVEVHLVELRVPGDLLERLHGHARGVHVEEEVGDALVLGGSGIRPRQQHHPVRDVREGGPHLLAVDHVVLAVLDRAGLERCQVRARVGLRVALAPDLLAGEHLGRVALLLLLGAVGVDGGAGHADGENVEDGRRLGQGHLLLKDHLLHEREAAAAGLLGPGQADEAGLVHLALPLPEKVVGLFAGNVRRGLHLARPVLREILRQPRAHLVPEGLLLGGQREVHTPSCSAGWGRVVT